MKQIRSAVIDEPEAESFSFLGLTPTGGAMPRNPLPMDIWFNQKAVMGWCPRFDGYLKICWTTALHRIMPRLKT
jgi:hypothetical protein